MMENNAYQDQIISHIREINRLVGEWLATKPWPLVLAGYIAIIMLVPLFLVAMLFGLVAIVS
jgi:hypothetical protein